MKRSMLSTIDNPHSPFDSFGAWYAYDVSSGYHSSSLLARLVQDSSSMSESDQQLAIERAIDEIVRENVNGKFIKVTKEFDDDETQITSWT
jgi:hypothetical protein